MSDFSFVPFSPEKMLRTGCLVLGTLALCAGGVETFFWISSRSVVVFPERKDGPSHKAPLADFSFCDAKCADPFHLADVEREMQFALIPPRPGREASTAPRVSIRLQTSGQLKWASLPCYVPLRYERALCFDHSSLPLFWVELCALENRQFEGKIWIDRGDGEKKPVRTFTASACDTPIQTAQDFPENSPFRILAEGRWWGHDLFQEKYGQGALKQRLDVGPVEAPSRIELEEHAWITWTEGSWQKIPSLQKAGDQPIAHLVSQDKNTLILEGWDAEEHILLSLKSVEISPFKHRPEELLTAIRVRSDRQISCMLEKQCLILKAGDWVLKSNHRWQVLRKKDRKDAYLNGELEGDLFLFQHIDAKGGQKVVQGELFNAQRSAMMPIEIPVTSQRQPPPAKEFPGPRKGKKK